MHPPNRAQIAEMGCEVLTHPPYSPDLALSHLDLLGPLRKSTGKIKFKNDDAVKKHVLKFLHSSDKDFYVARFTQLIYRCGHCTELHGHGWLVGWLTSLFITNTTISETKCMATMLRNNKIVVFMHLLLCKTQHESWNLLNNPCTAVTYTCSIHMDHSGWMQINFLNILNSFECFTKEFHRNATIQITLIYQHRHPRVQITTYFPVYPLLVKNLSHRITYDISNMALNVSAT